MKVLEYFLCFWSLRSVTYIFVWNETRNNVSYYFLSEKQNQIALASSPVQTEKRSPWTKFRAAVTWVSFQLNTLSISS